MLSRETLEAYRRMTVAERAELVFRACREHWPAMLEGPPEVIARRFELLRRENDARNKNMREWIARSRREDG